MGTLPLPLLPSEIVARDLLPDCSEDLPVQVEPGWHGAHRIGEGASRRVVVGCHWLDYVRRKR
jgi:hypothetical protein